MSDLYLGDCREVRSVLADNSIDTIITDPPYGLEFMGKGWDKGVPGVEFWREFLAVTKPGGMLLAFGGTRTFHRMTCAIEDAGWEIRDCMMWLYGSGFPKSHNLRGQFEGWGTALKPAWEPIIVAMKLLDGTFAQNAEKWDVAGINVDGGRIGTEKNWPQSRRYAPGQMAGGLGELRGETIDTQSDGKGRWPANLILDEDAAATLDEQSGVLSSGAIKASHVRHTDTGNGKTHGKMAGVIGPLAESNSGGASRFFYCAKASKSERNAGCDGMPNVRPSIGRASGLSSGMEDKAMAAQQNFHPTVKPLKLMEYLCTLTKTPTGGVVLDPFAGSGTTLFAAKNTGREYVGIEQNPEYFEIIKARLGLI